jgi:hypothetical protein
MATRHACKYQTWQKQHIMAIIGDDCKWFVYYNKADIALDIVINYAPRMMLQIVTSLADDYRGVIHDFYMFIVQGTERKIYFTAKYTKA